MLLSTNKWHYNFGTQDLGKREDFNWSTFIYFDKILKRYNHAHLSLLLQMVPLCKKVITTTKPRRINYMLTGQLQDTLFSQFLYPPMPGAGINGYRPIVGET